MVNRTVEVDDKEWKALHINSQNAVKLADEEDTNRARQKIIVGPEKCGQLVVHANSL